MSEGRDTDEDLLSDYWVTSWEQQTAQELESEADRQELLRAEADEANERMWALFQHAAQCVALMYKGGLRLSRGARGLCPRLPCATRGLSLSRGWLWGLIPDVRVQRWGPLSPALVGEGEGSPLAGMGTAGGSGSVPQAPEAYPVRGAFGVVRGRAGVGRKGLSRDVFFSCQVKALGLSLLIKRVSFLSVSHYLQQFLFCSGLLLSFFSYFSPSNPFT